MEINADLVIQEMGAKLANKEIENAMLTAQVRALSEELAKLKEANNGTDNGKQ